MNKKEYHITSKLFLNNTLKSKTSAISRNYFIILIVFCFISCKKNSPITKPTGPETIRKKDYKDYQFQEMAAESGYYITDTIWTKDKISDFVIRKSFDSEFLYPTNGDDKDLYLGSPIDGKYFMENKGVFKDYTKFKRNPLSLVTTNAYNFNTPNFRLDVRINNLVGMDSLVREYLQGAKPSLFGYSRYLYYPFSNYNDLKLFFGENLIIQNMFNISNNDDLGKVENGLVYYNRKETFTLRVISGEKNFFQQPYSLDVLKNDESGFVSSITYGKISIMTIDSKLAWREMNKIILNITANQPVSDDDMKIINAAKIHTYLRGYTTEDQARLLKNSGNALETIKAFIAITNPPTNFANSGTFTYEDRGVPIAFELHNTYSSEKFLKNFNYSITIKSI
ncbi:RAD14 family DNA repair protein [Pedobacter cryoconitis]|uniref:Uncharacterized protein n=1 Tax=Pedobacter cryoconitis TaxID=188932 RepID=A0A327SEI0_9SPHI|nr:hypothetical protein [Pedobacter cryoconitis]RAJ26073.1 hypothetical protein LY11_04006 [Pedobacter cryoconitis]